MFVCISSSNPKKRSLCRTLCWLSRDRYCRTYTITVSRQVCEAPGRLSDEMLKKLTPCAVATLRASNRARLRGSILTFKSAPDRGSR